MGRVSQLVQYITKSQFVRSIFLRTIAVFLIVISLIVIVVTYSFGSEINKSIVSDRKRQLFDIESAISSRMDEVMSIAYNIGQDSAFMLEPVEGIRYSGYEMSNTLARYLVGNKFIEHLAYYRLSEPEKIYTSSGELTFHRFWDAYLTCDNYTEETYLDTIRNSMGVKLVPLMSGDSRVAFFTYICPLPQFSTAPQAFVIAIIPLQGISALMESQLTNSYGEITLFDASGDKIFELCTLKARVETKPTNGSKAYSEKYMTISGERYIYQERKSGTNGWTYISVVRLNDIISGIAGTQITVIVAVIVLMVVAVWIILTGIIRRYKPISNLALTLTGSSTQIDGVIDEKSLLTDTIATLKSDSEQKQKFEMAYQEATEANKAKTRFLSNMSHDIRTPMSAIIGMTGIAMKHLDDPKYVRECLGKVDSASKYLLGIINNVLDMSRIESGKTTLAEDVIDIPSMIEQLTTIINANIEDKKQKLTVETKDLVNKRVIGDSVRLMQVCMNILSNAIKFTSQYGSVSMSVTEIVSEVAGSSNYRFVFTDTGIGMTPEFVDKVFDMFSRETDSGVSKTEGTGLGMAIAKNLVELMGGTIKCESVVDVGTTFTVSIPMKHASESDSLVYESVNNAVVNLKGKRILLAEDNAINREIAHKLIGETSAEVTDAHNGREAVDVFAGSCKDYFDLILMDIKMPVMDGYEAVKLIRAMDRADAKSVPIYAMTANTFDEDVQRVIESGMNGHLGKPYAPKDLFKVLNNVLAPKN